jgi:hypothetical protein
MIIRCSALLLARAAAGMAETNSWDLSHPNAKLLIGIDLKGLRESAPGQLFRAEMKGQPQQLGPAALTLGFMEQIDSVLISSPALASANKPAATNNPPFLMVVEGTLPLQQILAFLPGTSHRYHDVEIFRGAKATDTSIAMLDTRTILIGDEKSVLAAIDRRGHPLATLSPLMKRAKALAAAHEIWVIAADSLSKFQPAAAGAASPLMTQIASQIKGLDMGLAVHDGFQVEMNVTTESEALATEMAQLLSTQITAVLQSQAVQSPAASAQALEMVKKLHVETLGTDMRLSFALSSDEFAQQLRTAQAHMAERSSRTAAGSAGPVTTQQIKLQPKPAAPGKVKIYGLDEGVREIQLTH